MAQRTKSWGPGNTSTPWTHWVKPESSWVYDYSLSSVTAHESGGYAGVDIPNFHRRRRQGELLPMTNWSRWAIKGSAQGTYGPNSYPAPSTYMVKATPTGAYVPGFLPWLASTSDALAGTVDIDADYFVQAAASRIYARGWDALTFLSEFHKTVAMFRGFRKRLFKAIARGRLDKLWLEGRYGWRILWYDMQDIQKVLANLDGERRRFTERTGASFSKTNTTTSNTGYITSIISNAEYVTTDRWTISARGCVVADIQPPKIAFNPATTAWELTTFSFVVDWFVNVGQWLESLSFLALQTGYTASTGFKITLERESEITNVTWASGASGTYAASGSSTVDLLVRVPTTVAKTPRFSIRLDSGKLVDLAALARGFKR